MSAANVASLIFFVLSLMAAPFVGFRLRPFADEAGVNRWALAMVPAWFAVLYSQILYWNAEQKIRRLSQSVSRGFLVVLLTWVSFSALTSGTWCKPHDFGSCLSTSLLV